METNVKLEECMRKVQQENEDYKARMDKHAALSKYVLLLCVSTLVFVCVCGSEVKCLSRGVRFAICSYGTIFQSIYLRSFLHFGQL